MAKFLRVVLWILALIPVALVALFTFLYYQAKDRAARLAPLIYEAARDGRLDDPALKSITTEKFRDQMKAEDSEDGRVKAFRIRDVGAQITGIPWYADVEVVREHSTQSETIMGSLQEKFSIWAISEDKGKGPQNTQNAP